MAVDGWAPDGTPRLICLDPPGGDGSGGSLSSFTPNVFLGYPWPQTGQPFCPEITPGTGDFSLEVWARRKMGNSPGQDESFLTGLLENTGDRSPLAIARFIWRENPEQVSLTFDALGAGAPGGLFVTGAPTIFGLWSHYVGNFDRDGNLELFIDAISKGTTSIAAQGDSVVGELHALTSTRTFAIHNSNFNNWSSVTVFPVLVGPIAVHSRLMTNAEIQDSYRNHKVQNIAGAELINFDYSKVEGQTGWDVDYDNMAMGHKIGSPVPAAAPQGAAATVIVPDQSGNGNDWTLDTVADYTAYTSSFSSAEDGRWPFAFGVDPFFR